jgi:beta-glucosidase
MKGRTYRYFDDPLFAFGYGLSYTTFEIGETKAIPCDPSKTPDMLYTLNIPVKNTGSRAGTEIVQVYIRDLSDTEGPLKSLRGFQSLNIGAGRTAEALIQLSKESFEFWDAESNTMRTKPGEYEILYGTSSQPNDLKSIKVSIK